jgi:glutaredoxin
MNKIKIEFQYFNGCPNSESVLDMVRKYVNESESKIEFEEILVDTDKAAKKYKFRGSPTIQINGNDIEGLKENETPSLSCRFYPNGLPTTDNLRDYVLLLE